ncbi:laminin subunit alpha-like [Acropora millepora]|uniref:laminin subunit alpha-like n=1 Tax=Acropora millepora TaxID=45264 RepID=UPI001CF23991|nr:laminin subunit alpha-like [Acropora millepora]
MNKKFIAKCRDRDCIQKHCSNMDIFERKAFVLFVLFVHFHKIAQSSFNAAFMKHARANFTCGSPPEEFFETQQGFLSSVERVPYLCNASDSTRAYPPKNMIDGLLETHWQSKAGVDAAFITISFEQAFFVQSINITFGNYRRPGAIKIEKSTDVGASYLPWHYLVTNPASSQCQEIFGVQAFRGIIDRVDEVLCTEYSRYVPPEYNETLFIDLNQNLRSGGIPNGYAEGLQSWMNATAVRFSFSGLYRKFDLMEINWHHYTVREIAVNALCDCKGHANGGTCPFNQLSGLRTCQCQGNTCGMQCDHCCPLYNQFPWRPGRGAPWANDPDAKCEACNCHNHSDSCVFNQTVNDLGLSKSINGSMIGGGVCVSCQHNTQGINCEECKDYFYRPHGRNHSDVNACEACLCNLNGTANVSSLSFGGCVKDETVLSLHPGKQPGDCYCKMFVQGRQCDRCIAGYYRLAAENPHGCLACHCHLNGTINRTSDCLDNYSGQCRCKPNVVLRDCSECKDDYYDLQDSDINGCKFCDCDTGGTKTSHSCDKVTGACDCHPHIVGRKCDAIEVGFFYPDAHFISAAKSPYKTATETLSVVLDIPKTGNFSLLVHHANTARQEVEVQIIVQYKNVSHHAPQREEIYNFSQSFPADNQTTKIITGYPSEYLLLKKGLWLINMTTTQPQGGLKLDHVVAIPKEFQEPTVLRKEDISQFQFCDVESNDMSALPCLRMFFTIATNYLQGALACSCHPLGSNSSLCQSYGGQCNCKPGVEGRDCDRCKPGFYNLTDEGCTPCECNGPNKICDATSGMCECPENTTGRNCLPCQCNDNTNKCLRTGECVECQFNTTGFSCQHCAQGYFGDAVNQRCSACACNEVGSVDQQCNRETGQCNCRTKITGRNCSVCQTNTFGFGRQGCRKCECNSYGSANMQCSESGQCSCLANVTGLKCTQCPLGFYGLPTNPCQECNCNAIGAISSTACVNDNFGQCHCKHRVTGRECNSCMKYFTSLSDAGCSGCSRCIQSLRHSMLDTAKNTNGTEVAFQVLKEFSKLNAPLMETASLMEQAQTDKQQFYERIAAGNQLHHELTTLSTTQTNRSLLEINAMAQYVRSLSTDVAENSTDILEEVKSTKNKTSQVQHYLTSVDDIIGDIRTALFENSVIASQAMLESMEALKTTERNFTKHFQAVADIMKVIENHTIRTEETLRRIFSQRALAHEMQHKVKEKDTIVTKVQDFHNQSHDKFKADVEHVYNHSRAMEATLMETMKILEQELLALNRSQPLLVDTNLTITNALLHLARGEAVFEDLFHVNNALTNVSNVLKKETGETQHRLRNVTVDLIRAQTHTLNLETLARQIEETFNLSHSHASQAMLAIEDYEMMHETVNKALKLVKQANSTLVNITEEFSMLLSADLQQKAETIFKGLHDLSNDTTRRNHSLQSLKMAVYEVNETFVDFLALRNEIDETFPSFYNDSMRYLSAAAFAPEVFISLSDVQNQIKKAIGIIAYLEEHLSQTESVVAELLQKVALMRNMSKDGVTLINDSLAYVNNVTKQLAPNPVEPAVNATVREAKSVMNSLSSLRNQTESKINNASALLQRMRHLVGSIPFALHIENDSSIMLVPTSSLIESPHTSEISVDIKTYSSEGMLLFIAADQHNLTNGRAGETENSLGLYLSNNSVHLVLNLGSGPVTTYNPLELKNDTWYSIYIIRTKSVASLTVSGDIHERETVTMNLSSVSGENILQLTNESAIYVAGFPRNMTILQHVDHFSGIIDNLVVDNTPYNLWNPREAHGSGRLYASPRYKRLFYPSDGKAVSFFGNGYVQHALSQINSTFLHAEVELEFRTLHYNGVIMTISSDQLQHHVVLYLQNGQVNLYFESGITLKSTGSSYANGRWYLVRVVRTNMKATLSIRPAGSSETSDSRSVSAEMTSMTRDYLITFGDLPPNSPRSFVMADVFSGDIKNLRVFSDKSGTLVPRAFSDPLLLIAKQSVSFKGIIRGPIEYGFRFYGYQEDSGECSHAATIQSSEHEVLTSLIFTFKTEAGSGVLLYKRHGETFSLLMLILHGDLLIWLGDVKSSPVFSSSDGAFSDNSWRVLRFTLTANRYSLYVNESLLHSGAYDFTKSPILVHKPFYFGGVPRNLSSQVPYSLCFRGGMKDLLINSRSVSFLSVRTLGVSNAGVIPAFVPPPVPKTCVTPLDPGSLITDAKKIHFGLFESKGESYVGFNLHGKQSEIFRSK